MKFRFLYDNHPLVSDVVDYYTSQRELGYSREQALGRIRDSFQDEFRDEDDRPILMIANALALCKKGELTQEVRRDALDAIAFLKENATEDSLPEEKQDYEDLIQYLSEERIGAEAIYKKKKPYDPGWIIGDTFAHPLSQTMAERIGLPGGYILFRKVGEYVGHTNRHMQLVYITVCPADSIPSSEEELRSLGYLRMMKRDAGWDYLGQICFKSRKDQEKWGLCKIGCFPNAGHPDDATAENPVVSMPFFGDKRPGEDFLIFEDLVRLLIRFNGINKNPGR